MRNNTQRYLYIRNTPNCDFTIFRFLDDSSTTQNTISCLYNGSTTTTINCICQTRLCRTYVRISINTNVEQVHVEFYILNRLVSGLMGSSEALVVQEMTKIATGTYDATGWPSGRGLEGDGQHCMSMGVWRARKSREREILPTTVRRSNVVPVYWMAHSPWYDDHYRP